MKKPKICFIGRAGSVHTRKLINYFAKYYDIHLISEDNINIPNATLHYVRSYKIGIPSLLINTFKIKRIIKDINPSLLCAFSITVAGFWATFSRFHPFIVSAWGSDILLDSKRYFGLFKIITRHILKNADFITADSHILIKEMSKLKINKKKMMYINHGVDIDLFKPRELENKSNLNIICTRNLEPVYNIETLIKAIPLVVRKYPQARFILLGHGQQTEMLKRLSRKLKIENNVYFKGKIPNNDVVNYLNESDIYVSTSLSDSSSVSLLEAMSCELSLVISDIDANREWVTDRINGFLFPIRDYKELARKIIFLLDDKKLRKSFGIKNRDIIKKKADLKKEMKKAHELFDYFIKRFQ